MASPFLGFLALMGNKIILDLNSFSSGVALPWLFGVDGEQDHLRLELLQPLCVQLQRLHTLVPATVIDSNANGPGELLAQTSSLDLLKCESAASPLLEVVLVGRARDHGPQLSNGAGGNLGSLCNPVLAPADLPGWLVEPSLDIVLPVLVEVLVRHDIVPLCRHLLSCRSESSNKSLVVTLFWRLRIF